LLHQLGTLDVIRINSVVNAKHLDFLVFDFLHTFASYAINHVDDIIREESNHGTLGQVHNLYDLSTRPLDASIDQRFKSR
jgi:hypothetical protein